MNPQHAVNAFLGRYNFQPNGPDVTAAIEAMLYDMEEGLKADPANPPGQGPALDMIPTWAAPPEQSPCNTRVIVIDAGGTNFRSCLVSFDANGNAEISDMKKTRMIAVDREYGRKEFFDTIAENIDYLKDKANRIGFCFSWPMTIQPNGDGLVTEFSKEVKAKEVVGSLIGENLLASLHERGWEAIEKITLLNDTTAALLAGASSATGGKSYDSYVGFILGTGMNAAYIEYEPIAKIAGRNNSSAQIVVCESGKCNKIPQSKFDEKLDKTTTSPGLFGYEKKCSGAYLGPLGGIVLSQAAKDGLFSDAVAPALEKLDSLELKDMDQLFYTPYRMDTKLGVILEKGSETDREMAYRLLDAVVERSARLAAANIAASILKSGKGKSPVKPVCVLCEGTTFLKTHNLKNRVIGYLNTVLTEQRGIWYELVSMDNAVTLGSAVAGLI